MTDLYDALDICIRLMDQGQPLDAALALFPDQADELRPALAAALHARTMARSEIPAGVQQRGRARLLQHAAELREARRAPRRGLMPSFRRAAVTFGFSMAFFLSGTGLVSASSGALPGDQLYPVKRSWEDVRLFLVFSPQVRETLQGEFEQERLDETDQLLSKGREEPILFSGLITKRLDGKWLVSGIPVLITDATHLPADPISDGAPVLVMGFTRTDGIVQAQEIRLLPAGVLLPPFQPTDGGENELEDGKNLPLNSGTSQSGTPAVGGEESKPRDPAIYEFSGVVDSMHGDTWSINGQIVYVDTAEIPAGVAPGESVKFKGYFSEDGRFIVTSIEKNSDGKSGGSGKGSGDPPVGGDDHPKGGDD